ncbi:2-phospho-L-lactate guanylyltransferase [Nocardioides zeae]|uniref:2-phospho-L-lactate guanylyltransferase n=1 Tax=Nocardioides imazamoxiresistens TaxID=3231893 RepID=A0ABU3PXG5_9ACTN|nr:2-phospho-L-lactate guanylyltransferase [Nocardioides zeae]MDT9593915.1 2-phospho-L-lactate guanylyltransferase [Nocardioides zeae]
MSTTTATASVVLPVKPPAVGKSRLAVGTELRGALAAAFALDTATVALDTPGVVGVLVLCDDHRFAAELRALGCVVVPDPLHGDLNGTLRQGAAEAVRRWPDALPVALCADLPGLAVDDLAAAVAAATDLGAPCFVADADGTGTTMYAAPLAEFAPAFGPGSAAAHAARASAIPGDLGTLRHDVDDAAALAAAAARGVGPHTAALLA